MHVWYSAATDVTGKEIAKALGCKGSTAKPTNNEPVICWGTKTKYDVNFTGKMFNHPNSIRLNRNKLKALRVMKEADVNVAKFSQVTNDLSFPMIARTNYHQGGAGFWVCLNKFHVNNAIKEGAQYFQEFINIKNEFRLHVMDGKVIYAVKKVPRTNLKDAFVDHHFTKALNYATKNKIKVDEASAKYILKRLARELATGVDMITKSNSKGWKFSRITTINPELESEAIRAVKALSLDYGAVDCCLEDNGKASVIEVNTGPGLEGTSFKEYIKGFKALLKPTKKDTKAKVKAKAVLTKTTDTGNDLTFNEKLDIFQKLVEHEDPDKIAELEQLFKKIL